MAQLLLAGAPVQLSCTTLLKPPGSGAMVNVNDAGWLPVIVNEGLAGGVIAKSAVKVNDEA